LVLKRALRRVAALRVRLDRRTGPIYRGLAIQEKGKVVSLLEEERDGWAKETREINPVKLHQPPREIRARAVAFGLVRSSCEEMARSGMRGKLSLNA